jgi:hypothetical protein
MGDQSISQTNDMMSQERYWIRVYFRAKNIYSKTGGHVLTPFIGKASQKKE